MRFTPREDQAAAIAKGKEALLAGENLLIVSPTGSGKSVILAGLLEALPDAVLLVPTLDIGMSVYQKLDGAGDLSGLSELRVRGMLAIRRIFSTREYHNRLLSGAAQPPKYILSDEAHHDTDDTHTVLFAAAGNPPRVGVTATAYRGTPKETEKLREVWGEPWVALTLRKAVEEGIIARPDFSVWPLLNDELIDVRGGDFVTRQVENKLTDDVLEDLCERMSSMYAVGKWDRPTIIRCPGVASAGRVQEKMANAHLPASVVTGETSTADRQRAFSLCLDRHAALVQVKVVGEGIDLAARRLIDLAPSMSPVAWMQAVGRITRPAPNEAPPEYIATNHNLSRFAYLWAGLIPAAQFKAAQQAWGPDFKPSRRTMARALGLEGFGRFQVAPLPMLDGSTGSLYALQTKDGLHQYAVLLHSCIPDPLFFERENALTGRKLTRTIGEHEVEYAEKKFGKWKRINRVPDAAGYISFKPDPLTTPMLNWWEKDAARYGLDPDADVDSRQFVALPVLANTGLRFIPEE